MDKIIQKSEIKKQIQLTKRDLEILEFVLEMKFSDLKTIHQKFFTVTKSGHKSVSDWWARERVGLLKKHGFLTAKRISFSGTSYFLATQLAQMALSNMCEGRSFVQPLDEIDIRTFEHDRLVIEARCALERLGRATKWYSERRLKSEQYLTLGLARRYQPDAIYVNKLNEPVAFELEIAPKTIDRYEEKIRKYLEIIRSKKGFRAVLFVTKNDSVFNTLSELTRRYQGEFKVEKLGDLLDSNDVLKVSKEEGVVNG